MTIRIPRFLVIVILVLPPAGLTALVWSGGYWLVFTDPLPKHAEVAVVLGGSIRAEEARRESAVRLLQEGVTDQIMISVPEIGYGGQPMPNVIRSYIETTYGRHVSERTLLCIMPASVDSTADEAKVLMGCLAEHRLQTVVVITSNFHTRRAHLVWRNVLSRHNPRFEISVQGVSDGTFDATKWWSNRLYAKTWLTETIKLIWTVVFGTE